MSRTRKRPQPWYGTLPNWYRRYSARLTRRRQNHRKAVAEAAELQALAKLTRGQVYYMWF